MTHPLPQLASNACLVSKFLSICRTSPNLLAVHCDNAEVSYEQLETCAAQIAALFEAEGLRPGDRVSLMASPSLTTVAFMVAAFARGLIFVNLDAGYPEKRLKFLIRESKPRRMFHCATVDPRKLRRLGPSIALSFQSTPPPARLKALDLPEDRVACIFFSSGSTLNPKGILSSYAGICHFIDWQVREFSVLSGDRVSWLTPISFDVCLRDVFLPLTVGGTLCIPKEYQKQSGQRLFSWFAESGIKLCHVVPSVARFWLKTVAQDNEVPSLRLTFFAGEPLGVPLTRQWSKLCPNSEIVNLYGPTETTLAKFFHRIDKAATASPHPCGRTLPDTQFLVVDPQGNPVATGEKGEVLIVTRFPSKGYLVPTSPQQNLFADQPGAAPYATGDVGYVNSNGDLVLCGRIDHQVKVNGVRIEPSMIAAAVEMHSQVALAAVIAITAEDEDIRLRAFFEPADGASPSLKQDLRLHVSSLLPSAMVPAEFVMMPALPLLPNGKIDLQALRDYQLERSVTADAEPLGERAQCVLDAFREVFGRHDISADDDFFSVGGTSLQAMEILLHLEEKLGVIAHPADILSNPTARALGNHIEANSESLSHIDLPRTADFGPFPLAPQQDRFFRVLHKDGNRNWANMFAEWPLPTGTDFQAVQSALAALVERHDALRLRFTQTGGKIVQDTTAHSIYLEQIPFHTTSDATFTTLREKFASTPIDVFSQSAFQAALVTLPASAPRLLVRMHHLAFDGGSVDILKADFDRIIRGHALPPSSNAFRFRDFVAWSRAGRSETKFQDDRSYWASLFTVPAKHPIFPSRPALVDHDNCMALRIPLDDALRRRVALSAADLAITPHIVYLAAFFLTLRQLTRSDTLLVASPLAGRDLPELRGLVGNIMSVVLYRLQGQLASRADLMGILRTQSQYAVSHHAFQYHDILDAMQLDWDGSRYPLTGFSLNYRPSRDKCGAYGHHLINKGYDLIYDLLVVVFDHCDVTVIEFQYRRDRLDDDETKAIADLYLSTLFYISGVSNALPDGIDLSGLARLQTRIALADLPAISKSTGVT
ncbi:AMP-binding protein [Agrobacterium vitis]|uniref:amino acid adenylation domain-containing protein n=1 Tax=Agrobacterium vitis TaxID=373 RepID=UPI0012E7387E|nr:amino acid adenylation domain-containing protein [Agrobacterium vitis]MVA82492.1 AMP-binding protein [Agrobacterium vitis]